jgi:hypothetical protein
MKKAFYKLFVATTLLGAFAQAHASYATFSYNFVDGETISGRIDGTIENGTIDNITGIHAMIDGTPIAGGNSLFAGSYLPDASLVAGGGQFSSIFGANNFFISDQSDPNSAAITEEFSLFTTADGSSTTFAYANLTTGNTTADTFFNDGSGMSSSFGPNGFSAFNTGVAPQFELAFVPEPGPWALLAVGVAGMMLIRRRKVS